MTENLSGTQTDASRLEQTERRLRRAQALRDMEIAVRGNLDLSTALTMLLNHITTQLQVDAADILLLNPATHRLEYAAGYGLRTLVAPEIHLERGEEHAGRAVTQGRTLFVPDLAAIQDIVRTPVMEKERSIAYYGVPLISKAEVKGVLEIFHHGPLPADREWVEFLETMAAQVAITVEDISLYNALQRSNTELALANDALIDGWARALDLHTKEPAGHNRRVTELSLQVASSMGIGGAALEHIRRGALLHDIGKLGIPEGILHKPGPLTEAEWDIMRQHPEIGYQILSPITYLGPALEIPFSHHEKWDGTGYPRGIAGEEIPLAARIFTVVDIWDVLHSDQVYRRGWPEEKIRIYIREQSGKHFDPQVVDIFLR